jgi:hypothetical protein
MDGNFFLSVCVLSPGPPQQVDYAALDREMRNEAAKE